MVYEFYLVFWGGMKIREYFRFFYNDWVIYVLKYMWIYMGNKKECCGF